MAKNRAILSRPPYIPPTMSSLARIHHLAWTTRLCSIAQRISLPDNGSVINTKTHFESP